MLCQKEFRAHLARVTATALLLGWGVAWASVEVVLHSAPDLLSWPWLQIIVGMWVSSLGGGAATITRYLEAKYAGRTFHLRLEIFKDLAVSFVVGACTYFAGWLWQWSSAYIGLALILAGWLGVRILSAAADQLLSRIVVRRGI